MRRLRSRLTTLFGTTWAALATLFGLLLAIALTALILSGILWGKQGCNSPICQDCNSSCVACNISCIDCNSSCTDCNSTCIDCNSTCVDCNSTCTDCNSSCTDCVDLCTNGTGKIFIIITDN